MHKTLNYSTFIQAKSTRQYESNKVDNSLLLQNTRSVQEMEYCMSNSNKATNHTRQPFVLEKCIIFVILYVYVLTRTKTQHLKKTQKITFENIKNLFLKTVFYKEH